MMQTLTLKATKRTQLGGTSSRSLIRQNLVPGVLYGRKGKTMINIPITMQAVALEPLRKRPYRVILHIDGKEYPCILQDKKHHPVASHIIHVDFLHTSDKVPITMEIPLMLTGKPLGLSKGGVIEQKIRKIRIKALPDAMPEKVSLDISALDLGEVIRVQKIPTDNFVILTRPDVPVAAIKIPRALRSKQGQSGGDTERSEEEAAPAPAAE